jgi:hypothetical protein
MAYIRTNEDYDRAMGIMPSDEERRALEELRSAEADPGYCNPRKAKRLYEAEAEVRRLGLKVE